MYYPYLRGRQFELIALREFAQEDRSDNHIIPIIEPVRNSFSSLKLALPLLIKGGVKFALILNPNAGDFKKVANRVDLTGELHDELADFSTWIPAYLLDNNYEEVSDQIVNHGFKEVMIICSDRTDMSTVAFETFVSSPEISYTVSKENRTLKRKVAHQGKILIRLDDNFITKDSNIEYFSINEEKFSEEHLYYSDEGYQGFSDYTLLGSHYREGGALPVAVVIHLTYQKENGEVWVKHFVSNSNEDRSNIQGKFAEAAAKAVNFLDFKNIHTEASEELRRYYADGAYPGLGMVKKISIKHHLELLNEILTPLI